MALFNNRVIDKYAAQLDSATKNQADIISMWARNISKGIYDSETQNDSEFIQKILIEVLGYTGSGTGKSWSLAKNQPIGPGNVDVALGDFNSHFSKVLAPFELKGAKTKDLDAIMPGRHKSPVQQAWEYAMDAKGAKWVLVSNYREIRLYAVGYGRKDYEQFFLDELHDCKKFARFLLILSAQNLLGGKTQQLLNESEKADKQITTQLYSDYKLLRVKLIDDISKSTDCKSNLSAINNAQTILDRILFIAFAEDKGLLPSDTIRNAFETKNPYDPKPTWNNFKGLFYAVNHGSSNLRIPGYNGGLFKENDEIDGLKISDEVCEGFKLIADYDFDSDVSVNILGHIFEQSISDIEDLKASANDIDSGTEENTVSKRKQDGVFYTPPSITRYLVEHAIGGWLEEKRQELGFYELPELSEADLELHAIDIDRYKKKVTAEFKSQRQSVAIKVRKHLKFWEAYEAALKNIRIIDPACGSGAFLNEAFDFLFKEGTLVNTEIDKLRGEQSSLFRWDKHILSNNLFGVDLNAESVEITKLSLWLKTANKQEKLTYLDGNIKTGNSLINDSKATKTQALKWKNDFSEIFEEGGFDVVIGNPPYGASLSDVEKAWLEKNYESYEYQANTYVLFYELGLKILKNSGYIGYITPATFTYQHYFKKIRNLLFSNEVKSIAKYGFRVFEDADIGDTVTLIAKKSPRESHTIDILLCDKNDDMTKAHEERAYEDVLNEDGSLNLSANSLLHLANENAEPLEKCANIVVGIKPYQTGKGSPKQTKDIVKNKPFTSNKPESDDHKLCLVGSNFHRYRLIQTPTMWLKYGDWLAEPRKEAPFFDRQKIIVRQTADTIIAHLDETQSVNLNNVYNIGSPREEIDIKYLLCLLNSELMEVLYREISQEKGKLFAEVKKVYLKKLPIKIIPAPEQAAFIKLADKMLQKGKALTKITLSFQNLVQSEFDLTKLSKRLSNWHRLNFADFVIELKKNKVSLSLAQKNEWLEYFEGQKAQALSLEESMAKTSEKINEAVYTLYGIPAKEPEG